MNPSVLLITPPFTQLNTPYPATSYIKGFLNTKGYSNYQADLGIEVILKLFSSNGLEALFQTIEQNQAELSSNAARMVFLKKHYLETIDPVMRFLQHKNPTLAYTIDDGKFLPRANRFFQNEDLDWAFGTMGIQDRSRHFATLYLEDLADLIREVIDPFFGFSRYAERLGRSASSFDNLEKTLIGDPTFTDQILIDLLKEKINSYNPSLIALSVPFPGNLYSAFRCGKYIKENYPAIKVVMGGGYPNTELRLISDPRVFKYIDFITLDDGERPLLNLLEFIAGKRPANDLKRTFRLEKGKVEFINGGKEPDFPFSQTGTPDYSDLLLDKYISVIEIANPMHRLWSDGRWNKLTMAHGCYWKKCSFCDISLDYINKYDPVNASLLCNRIEDLINNTGETGFHFVDEAAPPALMRDLAIEIIKRGLTISWWANIRFEQRFTADLCKLLKASGCIAVSGGLEVASDRLLEKMKKGVTVSQVAQVAYNFTEAGIMVHAYLMYGFPTQTEQETIDSLEMVRQFFEYGVLQSAFWHLFSMTAHSPVGMDPAAFGVVRTGPEEKGFAVNDLYHDDPSGANHEEFGEGLRKALFNYMHGIGFDTPLQDWFDFEIPRTTIPPTFIQRSLITDKFLSEKETHRVIWLGGRPKVIVYEKQKKGKTHAMMKICIETREKTLEISTKLDQGQWLTKSVINILNNKHEKYTLKELSDDYQLQFKGDLKDISRSEAWVVLRKEGLLLFV